MKTLGLVLGHVTHVDKGYNWNGINKKMDYLGKCSMILLLKNMNELCCGGEMILYLQLKQIGSNFEARAIYHTTSSNLDTQINT